MGMFRPDPKDGRQSYRFLPRGRELTAQRIFNSHYARPDIRIRVRKDVIHIHREQARIRGIIPITAGNATREHAVNPTFSSPAGVYPEPLRVEPWNATMSHSGFVGAPRHSQSMSNGRQPQPPRTSPHSRQDAKHRRKCNTAHRLHSSMRPLRRLQNLRRLHPGSIRNTGLL